MTSHCQPSLRQTAARTDALLGALLGLVAVGNIVLPEQAQSPFGVHYLMPSLLLVSVMICRSILLGRLHKQDLLWTTAFLCVSMVGFLGHSATAYVSAKLLGFVIAAILMLAPAAGSSSRRVVGASIVTMMVATVAISVMLVVKGEVYSSGRLTVYDLNPIAVGRSGSLLAVLAFVLLVHPSLKVRARVLGVAALSLGVTAAALTGSRGPLLACVVAIGMTLLVLLFRSRTNPWSLAVVPVGAVVVWATLSTSSLSSIQRLVDDDSSGRNDLWAQTLSLIANEPLGVGWGQFAQHVTGYLPDADGRLYAHNIVLEIAVEGGIPAAAVFLVLLATVSYRIYRRAITGSEWVAIASFALLVYFLANAMLSSDIVGNRALWLILGVGLLSHSEAEERVHSAGMVGPSVGSRSSRLTPASVETHVRRA